MDNEKPVQKADASSAPEIDIQAHESESGELNWSLTLSHAGGKEEIARQLASVYLRESSDLIEKMRISIESGDKVTLARACHTLKGASGYFGASRPDQAWIVDSRTGESVG